MKQAIGYQLSTTPPQVQENQPSEVVAVELARANAKGLIDTADILTGVERNLVLLEQHFEIVAQTLANLDSPAK